MNRSISHLIIMIFSIPLFFSSQQAQASSVKGAAVTVYNSGDALVRETRSVNLPAGLASVVFKDVPGTLDPTSVHASAKNMVIRDVQYNYTPITQKNLLDYYVGKEITVVMADPTDAQGRVRRKAVLLGNEGQPIFQIGEEVFAGNYYGFVFPELPKELQGKPMLSLTTDSSTAGSREVALSYLMGGISWNADYSLVLDTNTKGKLEAWATIANNSGTAFNNASLKLVAGNVNRQNRYGNSMHMKGDMVMAESMPAMSSQPRQEQFAQFHLYDIDWPVRLPANGTKQLSLFSSSDVTLEEELVSRFHVRASQWRKPVIQQVEWNLKLMNTKKNGLGSPMPAGRVRVFKQSSDDSLLLAGEDSIGHIAKNGSATINMGRAFDIAIERRQTEYEKLGKNTYRLGWAIDVTNGRETAQKIVLRESYDGQWEVITSEQGYEKTDAGTIEIPVELPPAKENKTVTVNYTVQVTY
ncbi:conserved exported protein of unknown function [Pseudodesulfovibrio profundus]|uniref:DUF4140 domain-containing protein n=2 Tax=Pseudodesulfovibrio profundus TaxID=57320 RepID=A0A2C8FDH6_9BACT|nr:conserved exported protein of unknown function [Pseudodesulfovibrio profundus]